MVDFQTASEESWKRGFETGYVRRTCDDVAEAMSGSILWHEGVPKEDRSICYICMKTGASRYTIRPAVYKAKYKVYFCESYTDDGSYYMERIDAHDVRFWAEVSNPFTMKLTFEVPEAKP